MEIESATYQVFYKKLCQAVIQITLKGNSFKAGKGLGRTLWRNVQSQFHAIFKSDPPVSYDYFYIKYRQFKKRPNSKDTLDDELMINAFKYLPSLKDSINGLARIAGQGKRAKYLHDQFIEFYRHELDELLADQKLAEPSELVTLENYKDLTQSPRQIGLSDEDKRSIYDLITKYFKHLSNGNYGLAWNLISNHGKVNWARDFDVFKRFQLDNIKVGTIDNYSRKGPVHAACLIQLSWRTPFFQINDRDNLSFMKCTMDYLDYFVSKLKVYRRDLSSIRDHPELLLRDFFKPNYFIVDGTGVPGPIQRSGTRSDQFGSTVSCKCILENKKWRIVNFSSEYLLGDGNGDDNFY